MKLRVQTHRNSILVIIFILITGINLFNTTSVDAASAPSITSWNGIPSDSILRGKAVIGISTSGTVALVRFRAQGPRSQEWNEDTAPYYFLGDKSGVPTGWNTTEWPDGAYILTARACNSANMCSERNVKLTIANKVVTQPSTQLSGGPAVTGWDGVPSDGVLRGRVAVEARTSGTVVLLTFRIQGPKSQEWVEKAAPYFVMGDNAGAPNGWNTTEWPDGAYTLTARACSSASSCGESTISVSIANRTAATPTPATATPAPTQAPTQTPTQAPVNAIVTGWNGVPSDGVLRGRVAVEARTNDTLAQLTFRIQGPKSQELVEKTAPYFVMSDNAGTPNGWNTTEWPDGAYTITAHGCTTSGTCGESTINVSIANQTAATPAPATATPAPTQAPTTQSASPAPKTTYYVDCASGADSNSGTAPDRAWKSVSRANAAALAPADYLLFKRGCTWSGPLNARWQGTASQPIVIGAYGTGNLPKIQNGNPVVAISGKYQIVEYLEVWSSPPPPYPNAQRCTSQPTGWRVGFAFTNNGSYNTVRYAKATGQTAGIHFNTGSHYNKALANTLINNTIISTNTPPSEKFDDDSGAWGVLLNSDYNEVAYNTFSGNSGCSEDYGVEGASIEVYQASNNFIHHNRSINDTTFTELGGTPTDQAENNVYAYNLYAPVTTGGQFVVVRGSLSKWGGNPGTKLYNNTAYMVSLGVSCSDGCDGATLTMRNNIIWSRDNARWAALWSDRPFNESNNIYWQSDGTPQVTIGGSQMSSSSRVANPQFVDPANYDFRLRSTSPAINLGSSDEVLRLGVTTDLNTGAIPLGGKLDAGAFEAS